MRSQVWLAEPQPAELKRQLSLPGAADPSAMQVRSLCNLQQPPVHSRPCPMEYVAQSGVLCPEANGDGDDVMIGDARAVVGVLQQAHDGLLEKQASW